MAAPPSDDVLREWIAERVADAFGKSPEQARAVLAGSEAVADFLSPRTPVHAVLFVYSAMEEDGNVLLHVARQNPPDVARGLRSVHFLKVGPIKTAGACVHAVLHNQAHAGTLAHLASRRVH